MEWPARTSPLSCEPCPGPRSDQRPQVCRLICPYHGGWPSALSLSAQCPQCPSMSALKTLRPPQFLLTLSRWPLPANKTLNSQVERVSPKGPGAGDRGQGSVAVPRGCCPHVGSHATATVDVSDKPWDGSLVALSPESAMGLNKRRCVLCCPGKWLYLQGRRAALPPSPPVLWVSLSAVPSWGRGVSGCGLTTVAAITQPLPRVSGHSWAHAGHHGYGLPPNTEAKLGGLSSDGLSRLWRVRVAFPLLSWTSAAGVPGQSLLTLLWALESTAAQAV